jgi:peptidyl-dipeptidase A
MRKLVSSVALAAALISAPVQAQQATPSVADAEAFIAKAEKDLFDFSIEAGRVQWINSTYIIDDTDAIAAKYGEIGTEKAVAYALEAAKFQNVAGLSAETRRKLDILRGGLVLPAPTREGAAAELSTIATRLQSTYGKGKGTLNGKPINGSDIEAAMGTNRNPQELKEMWTSWHDNVGKPMQGGLCPSGRNRQRGRRRTGLCRCRRDVALELRHAADDFAKLTDKLWLEVKPLYDELHCYTRTKLNAKYGDAVQAKTGPIRADLLGNMWAQEWGNIYDIVAPEGAGDMGYDITDLLKDKGY